MKKKIKDLTKEECKKFCAIHMKRGTGCLNEYGKNIECPFYYSSRIPCLKVFVEQFRRMEEEIEIDD